MSSASFDLDTRNHLAIDRGATWTRVFKYGRKGGGLFDITGYGANFEAFNPETNQKLIDASVANGKINRDDTLRKFTVKIDPADTLPLPDLLYYYFSLVLPDGTRKRLLRGNIDCVGIRGQVDPAMPVAP
ncbi:MAG: hypothetical protein ACKO0Z_28095 [Betaproteobacteria bacterium]